MTEYTSTIKIAQRWGVTQRRIAQLCLENRVIGAKKIGRTWVLHMNTQKPCDARIKTGKYLLMNVGDYVCTTTYGGTSSLYTYVNTPSGSTVASYGPADNTVTSSSFTISLSYPASASFTVSNSLTTKYRLDAGGPGSSYVQLRSNKYSSLTGDTSASGGDVIHVTQPVEYTNTSNACNGSFTFNAYNTIANHNNGFYLN